MTLLRKSVNFPAVDGVHLLSRYKTYNICNSHKSLTVNELQGQGEELIMGIYNITGELIKEVKHQATEGFISEVFDVSYPSSRSLLISRSERGYGGLGEVCEKLIFAI